MKIAIQRASVKILCVSLLTMASCSSPPPSDQTIRHTADRTATMAGDTTGGIVIDATSQTLTVNSIDKDHRTVVLRHPDGSISGYQCGPEVRNFDQIKVGDRVTATVAEAEVVYLVKGDTAPSAEPVKVVARAPEGGKPSAKIVQTVGTTGTVLNVDYQNRRATLLLGGTNAKAVKVAPGIDLESVKPGDHVGVRLTQAFALNVASPQ